MGGGGGGRRWGGSPRAPYRLAPPLLLAVSSLSERDPMCDLSCSLHFLEQCISNQSCKAYVDVFKIKEGSDELAYHIVH